MLKTLQKPKYNLLALANTVLLFNQSPVNPEKYPYRYIRILQLNTYLFVYQTKLIAETGTNPYPENAVLTKDYGFPLYRPVYSAFDNTGVITELGTRFYTDKDGSLDFDTPKYNPEQAMSPENRLFLKEISQVPAWEFKNLFVQKRRLTVDAKDNKSMAAFYKHNKGNIKKLIKKYYTPDTDYAAALAKQDPNLSKKLSQFFKDNKISLNALQQQSLAKIVLAGVNHSLQNK